jgi:hypothetical protein
MIIPTLIPPLLEEIAAVFAQPERYGLPASTLEGLALLEILEALLPSPQWEWLTADDLAPALRKSDRFQLSEDRVVYTGPASWLSSLRATMRAAMAKKVPSELILAFPKSESGMPVSQHTPLRLYAARETAMIVAGARSGTFEDVRLRLLRTKEAMAGGTRVEPLGRGVFLCMGLGEAMLEEMPLDLAAPWMDELRYRLKLAETLFLDDPGPQADAARALFELRPQAVVENDLIQHLTRGDRFVSINVLTALGLPAYKVGFVPGEPLPPREERLEPATLRPETIRAILGMAHEERDAGVLSYVLCTLKAQTYTGKLRDVSLEVRDVVRRDVLPRVEDPSVINDAKELLGLLPPMM